MEMNTIGDLSQLKLMLDGIAFLDELTAALATPSRLGWIVIILFFFTLLYYLNEVLTGKRKHLASVAAFIIGMPILLDFALYSRVPVQVGGASASLEIREQININKADIEAARALAMTGDHHDIIMGSRHVAVLEAANEDLKKMLTGQNSAVAHVPQLFASIFTISQAAGQGIWSVLSTVQLLDPSSRQYQAVVTDALSHSPQISAVEQQSMHRLAECLRQKMNFPRELNSFSVNASVLRERNDDTELRKKVDRALENLDSLRQRAARICQGIGGEMAQAVDDSITPEQIEIYKGGYVLPLVGRVGAADREDKIEFLAGQIGLSAEQARGMSDDELTRAFLRYKHIQALDGEMERYLTGEAGWFDGETVVARKEIKLPDPPIKAQIGEVAVDWIGEFLLGVRPIIKAGINYLWFFLIISWSAVCIWMILPGTHFKAPLYFLHGCIFLVMWSVTINLIETYSARLETAEVGLAQQTSGPVDKLSVIAGDAWKNLKNSASDLAVGGGAAAGSAAFRQVLAGIATSASAGPGLIPAVAANALALGAKATTDAWQKLSVEQQKMAKVIGEVGEVDPLLLSMANGSVASQRKVMEDIRNERATMEGLLLLASPLITFLTWFLGFKAIAGLNMGGMMAGAGQQAGGMLLSMGGGFGRRGGMPGKTPTGGGQGGGGKTPTGGGQFWRGDSL